MKSQEHCKKIVNSGNEKKYMSLVANGAEQEKIWIIEAMGEAAGKSDPTFNNLVSILQSAKEKPVQLAAIHAMGETGRSTGVSHLNYLYQRSQDAEIKDACLQAMHQLK